LLQVLVAFLVLAAVTFRPIEWLWRSANNLRAGPALSLESGPPRPALLVLRPFIPREARVHGARPSNWGM
jgi:hypothetical protein